MISWAIDIWGAEFILDPICIVIYICSIRFRTKDTVNTGYAAILKNGFIDIPYIWRISE